MEDQELLAIETEAISFLEIETPIEEPVLAVAPVVKEAKVKKPKKEKEKEVKIETKVEVPEKVKILYGADKIKAKLFGHTK